MQLLQLRPDHSGSPASVVVASNNNSPLYLLALRGPETHRKFLRSLRPKTKERLRYKWRGWQARANQLAPAGDWRVWLILAGFALTIAFGVIGIFKL